MQLKTIKTPGISHFAYLLTDGKEAVLVDPRRDVQEYLDCARSCGASIRYVIETHRQEDFVMGSAWLAKRCGARIVNGDHELFGHGDIRLSDGETVKLGSLTIKALHTPGHTPESMCYAVFTEQNLESGRAFCIFTGDTLFYGETGRTDLTDESRSVENAALLYDSVHKKISTLNDTSLILPAHGPGSVCGSGMADRPVSTLGEEKRCNPVFTLDREDFSRKKGGEKLPKPPYFRHMEKVNLEGGLPPVVRRGDAMLLSVDAFADASKGEIIMDCREPEAFAAGHLTESYSIWLDGLPAFGGWVGTEKSPVYLISDRGSDIDQMVLDLSRIGIDNIKGGLAGGFSSWRMSGKTLEHCGVITARELRIQTDNYQVLDVRESAEYEEGHISGAVHCFVGYLEKKISKLDLNPDRPVVVTCGVGHRASLGVSILLRAGFDSVFNLLGGMSAWKSLDYPLE